MKKADRDKKIVDNLPLVWFVIHKYFETTPNHEELYSAGVEGLIYAVDHFDSARGVEWSTYAGKTIWGRIRRYIRDNWSLIRVTRKYKDLGFKIIELRRRGLTTDEIADQLNTTTQKVEQALAAMSLPMSLDDPCPDCDDMYLIDRLSDQTETTESWTESLDLKNAINQLDPRERQVIWLWFYKGKKQRECAEIIGESQANVSRLKTKALKKIKQIMEGT